MANNSELTCHLSLWLWRSYWRQA